MSLSPVSRRRASTDFKEQEDLINGYEAEEERITNVLLRKLEKLRQDKIELENTLEAESESHVNRLTRELSLLKAQQQAGTQALNGSGEHTSDSRSPADPSTEVMLEALRRENEQLRNRLVDFERDYVRLSRLNEIYREELIEHRTRLGLSVDNLVGLSSSDPYTQPSHRRSSSSFSSRTSSPSTSLQYPVPHHARPIPVPGGVPIPRPPSQVHRPINNISEVNTPLSHSPTSASSASESPYTFSPGVSTNPASFISNGTNVTTPPSSASNAINSPVMYGAPSRGLSYPSVPPPSLSSSFGSPNISYYMGRDWERDPTMSPVEPLSLSRRTGEWRVAETGSLRTGMTGSRRASVERGARVAETGTLVPRSRAASQSHPGLPATSEAPDGVQP
ncbi:isoform d [Moniliophthora roreri MCA 2997]|uniref:Isoform d n=1 Tax=Moniliophthora roreri (strain MCA 2997) TaxID=1381753 RepID=V2X0C3_MONRO|nr:isoform d [Moniliophthora roreri MCA 2997]